MKNKLLNAIVVSSLCLSGYVVAEQTTTDKVSQVVEKTKETAINAGDKLSKTTTAVTEKVDQYIDETKETVKATAADKMNQVVEKTKETAINAGDKLSETTTTVVEKVDKYIDDAAITAKVKRAIADDNLEAGYTISVVTKNGIVTLSGFVPDIEWQLKAVKLASAVEGVQSVSDKLHIKEDKPTTLKAYSSDAKITSEVKAKLLLADNVPLTGIKVETVSGIVQLSGFVKSMEQINNAERVAKTVKGVQTVKNDLIVQP